MNAYTAKADYNWKMNEVQMPNAPTLESASPVTAEMDRLRNEVERTLKISYTLADRLQAVLTPLNTKDTPVGVPQSTGNAPMVDNIEAIRRTLAEGTNILVSIMDRLAL